MYNKVYMIKMGIKKLNGQKVLCFTCVQCKKEEVVDFRQYPLCKKCNKNNERLAKRNKSGHSDEKKED